MLKPLYVALAATTLLVWSATAQVTVPQTSYADAPDGVAAAFAGEWSAFRHGGEDRTLVTCGSPIVLSPNADNSLEYELHDGLPFDIQIEPAHGGTVWTSEVSPEHVAIWTGKNQFHLHPLTEDGTPDWSDIMVHYRCTPNPQLSYEGALDGDATPFIGSWSIAYRHHTGNHPDEILASCEDGVTISGIEQNYILHDDPEGTTGNVTLSKHEGHTEWQFDDLPYPWEVVWITPDRFHAYLIGVFGDTNWRLPFIYERCA